MKSGNTFSVIFFTRRSKNGNDMLSIYARITVNNQRTEISIKRNIPSRQWDKVRKKGKGTSQNIRILNNYLDYVYGHLLLCHKQLLEKGETITATAIKARYLGEDEQNKTFH